MNAITREQLKEFNDNVQICLRLKKMCYLLRADCRQVSTDIENAFLGLKTIANKSGLLSVDCSCGANAPEVRTIGFMPFEPGFKFECAHCRNVWTWTPVHGITKLHLSRWTNGLNIPVVESSWIESIGGTWDSDALLVENVVLKTKNGIGAYNQKVDCYTHKPIPYHLWLEWSESKSLGSFWHSNILKGDYVLNFKKK